METSQSKYDELMERIEALERENIELTQFKHKYGQVLHELSRKNTELQMISDGARAVLESMDFSTTARQIFHYCKTLIGAEAGYVALLNETGEENDVQYLDGGGLPCSVDPTLHMPVRGLRELVYRTQKTSYNNDYANSPHVKFMPTGHIPLKNVMFAPLKHKGKSVGLLGLGGKESDFTESDAALATAFAEFISVALINSHNLDQLMEQEEFLLTVINSLTYPFLVINADTYDVELANTQARLGETDFQNCKCYELSHKLNHPCDQSDECKCPLTYIKEMKTPLTMEHVHYDKNNNPVYLEISSFPVFDKNGKVVKIVEYTIDVTHRKKIENALRESERQLTELNNRKDRFISTLAHDLKNPFTSLLGFAGLLAANADNYDMGKIKQQANIINTTATQIYHLLNDLLLWAKANDGNLPFEPEYCNFTDICNESLELKRILALDKNIQISVFDSDQTELIADKNMLKTVLRNLVSNAIKFTNENGAVNIHVEKANGYAIITVSDDGVGINRENYDKLWEFTDKYTTIGTKGESGSGLGLILCKDFVEKHNGKIWVESEPGKGSDFKFTMPLYNP